MPGRPASTRPDGPDGPAFDETRVIHSVITSYQHQLTPDITASIPKGFFQGDGKWTCYRRNYFNVSCSFSFPTSYDAHFYLQRHSHHQPEHIKHFAVSITAKTAVMNTNQESEVKALVQQTAKRDKATVSVPGKVMIQPVLAESLSSSAALFANGNLYDYNQHLIAPTSHTFERIQFQTATAHNGDRGGGQQYFHIVVELFADVSRAGELRDWVPIATKQSEPMVVRGRSKGHYDKKIRKLTAS